MAAGVYFSQGTVFPSSGTGEGGFSLGTKIPPLRNGHGGLTRAHQQPSCSRDGELVHHRAGSRMGNFCVLARAPLPDCRTGDFCPLGRNPLPSPPPLGNRPALGGWVGAEAMEVGFAELGRQGPYPSRRLSSHYGRLCAMAFCARGFCPSALPLQRERPVGGRGLRTTGRLVRVAVMLLNGPVG